MINSTTSESMAEPVIRVLDGRKILIMESHKKRQEYNRDSEVIFPEPNNRQARRNEERKQKK
jgi:hypothetical protein